MLSPPVMRIAARLINQIFPCFRRFFFQSFSDGHTPVSEIADVSFQLIKAFRYLIPYFFRNALPAEIFSRYLQFHPARFSMQSLKGTVSFKQDIAIKRDTN